ncbi:hypothetical protein BU16DRAFT_339613 [Lophium mytilinum]|uniref:Uncharacterized protein n=1 Tax=Lophium mytilinum TaxID=390894 RepID=A0A6A6QW74_9PEZI|nr:hypothetical protein BU16DRAFT_339613 [Lophium mytilinum]
MRIPPMLDSFWEGFSPSNSLPRLKPLSKAARCYAVIAVQFRPRSRRLLEDEIFTGHWGPPELLSRLEWPPPLNALRVPLAYKYHLLL